MTISMKIDNFDALPDGGPLIYQAHRRGFEIGREHRDWTLPDPNMFISGRHCEIRFEKDGYWLYDVSRNGTFLNGSQQRIKSPHLLANGDRLKIGQYLVAVSVDLAGEADEGDASPFVSAPRSADNIWDTGEPAPPPINRRDLMPPQRRGQRSADFAERHLEMPPVRIRRRLCDDFPRAARAKPTAAGRPVHGRARIAIRRRGAAPQPPAYDAPDPVPAPPRTPAPFDFGAEPFAPPSYPSPAPPPTPQPQRPLMPPPVAAAAPAGAGQAGAEALLRGIAAGAGVSPTVFLQRDQSDVAAEIGMVLRTVVEELAILLKARAAAKLMAKSGNRTMISAVDNNPLKFVPRPEEVLEIMFARRAGYLDAKRSINEAFQDLKTHEFATYAAMQKALSRLLEDLSPEAIEKKVTSSAFGSKKSRAWETFVATWEAKEKPHENGMLDVFLAYFSDAYAKASKPK